jgi:L-amino acid N-acyltransferase YncA
MRIEPKTAGHAPQVLAIYQAGIDEGDATFETLAPGWAQFSAARLPDHRYVAIGSAGAVAGWVAAARPRTGGYTPAWSSTRCTCIPPPAARGQRAAC